ncbi:apn-1, partial [Pristionchus pacificus]|uniref:Xylose isomerase-like TIM barrel domain-containing protein n=1 Tax=Pristionchus pacificus TaxID=54126 RepID=A0A8R1V7C2_PRIPA
EMSGRATRSRTMKSDEVKEETNENKETTTVAKKNKGSNVNEEVKEMKMKKEVKEEEEENEENTVVKKVKAKKAPVKKEGTESKSRSKKVKEGETEDEKKMRETIGKNVIDAAEGSKKRLGMHASAAGTVSRAIHDARSIGCHSFALFVRNQRQWNSKPMEDTVVDEWNKAIKDTGFPLKMILPHGSYLLNPGSPDEEKLKKSREAMLEECTRTERLGITMYNFHPGSSTGIGTREDCIRTVAETIDYVLERTDKIALVVETMAGQGHTVGGTFEEIRSILDQVKGDSKRVGVCIDTCHIFAAGYDIRTKETYEDTMKKFGSIVGFDRLMALHLNDSKSELGCNLDRHEHIGQGKIGVDAFEYIMNDKRFDDIPLILETPEGDYPNEMILLYGLEKK